MSDEKRPNWWTTLGYRIGMWIVLKHKWYYRWSRFHRMADTVQRDYKGHVPLRSTVKEVEDFMDQKEWLKDSTWEFGDAVGQPRYFEEASETKARSPLRGALYVAGAILILGAAVGLAIAVSPWALFLLLPALVLFFMGWRLARAEVAGRDCDEFAVWCLDAGRDGLGYPVGGIPTTLYPVGLAQILYVEVKDDGSEVWGGHNVAVFRYGSPVDGEEDALFHLSNWGFYAGRIASPYDHASATGYKTMEALAYSVSKSWRYLMGWSIIGADLKTRGALPKRDRYRFVGGKKPA